ncbi:hypothetical protein DFH06DRAFT_1313280 [Mycena polygramma]|nr:hypothetical protein DFH06DRAFT_1313280 [Mycena polygramma]
MDDRDRRQFHNYSLAADDRHRAREANVARSRGFSPAESASPRSEHRRRSPPRHDNKRDTPARTTPNPDLNAMPRGSDAHPQSAWAVAQDSTNPPPDDVVCPPSDTGFIRREMERIEIARQKPFRARHDGLTLTKRVRDERKLGAWMELQISTLRQAYNLCALLAEGSEESYEMFLLTVSNRANFPLEFRSEGDAYLLSRQQELEKTYWTAATGEPRPSRNEKTRSSGSRRHYSASSGSEDDGPLAHRPHETRRSQDSVPPSRLEFGTTKTPANLTIARPQPLPPVKTTTTAARPQPPRPPAPRTQDAPTRPKTTTNSGRSPTRASTPSVSVGDGATCYLGSSPPDAGDRGPTYDMKGFPAIDARPNSKWSIGEVVYIYSKHSPSTWAKGVRSFLLQVAEHTGDSPHREDVRGYMTLQALAPRNTRELNHQYRLFVQAAVRLFSIRGLFAHMVQVGGYPFARLAVEHYGYLTDNITMALIAAWFVQHGLEPGSDDVTVLEDFARVRRNMQAKFTDLDNEVWHDEPYDASALKMPEDQIPKWADVHHAPIAPDTGMDGLQGSVHAPMEDVLSTFNLEGEDVIPSPPPSPIADDVKTG